MTAPPRARARSFFVRVADWQRDGDRLRAVRRAVFIDEQGVPEAMEWDEADARSRHVLATDDSGAAIGTGRLLSDGHIGRVAVLRDWRGQGVGQTLMVQLMDIAQREGHRAVVLNAQVSAEGFYSRLGFVVRGEPFHEAGIPHCEMWRTL